MTKLRKIIAISVAFVVALVLAPSASADNLKVGKGGPPVGSGTVHPSNTYHHAINQLP